MAYLAIHEQPAARRHGVDLVAGQQVGVPREEMLEQVFRVVRGLVQADQLVALEQKHAMTEVGVGQSSPFWIALSRHLPGIGPLDRQRGGSGCEPDTEHQFSLMAAAPA